MQYNENLIQICPNLFIINYIYLQVLEKYLNIFTKNYETNFKENSTFYS